MCTLVTPAVAARQILTNRPSPIFLQERSRDEEPDGSEHERPAARRTRRGTPAGASRRGEGEEGRPSAEVPPPAGALHDARERSRDGDEGRRERPRRDRE